MKFNNFFITLISLLLFITTIFADINDRNDIDERDDWERDDWYNNYERALYPYNFHRKSEGRNLRRDFPIFYYKRDASPKANFHYYKLQKSSNESNQQDEEDNEHNRENDESESNNQKRNAKDIPYYYSSPGYYYLYYKKEATSPYYYYKREFPPHYNIQSDDSP